MNRTLIALAAGGLAAAPLSAQARIVDEGSFTITRDGRVGREDFRIVRSPDASGGVYVATASLVYGDRRLSPALRTDSAGTPLAYQVDVRVGNGMEQRLRGVLDRRRFSASILTPRGESAKEYLVGEGALVLDEDVFHQYYFLGQRTRADSMPVIVPRRNAQFVLRVTGRDSQPLVLGGVTYTATHLVLAGPAGETSELWLDDRGRVLKVALRDRGLVATRDAPLP